MTNNLQIIKYMPTPAPSLVPIIHLKTLQPVTYKMMVY